MKYDGLVVMAFLGLVFLFCWAMVKKEGFRDVVLKIFGGLWSRWWRWQSRGIACLWIRFVFVLAALGVDSFLTEKTPKKDKDEYPFILLWNAICLNLAWSSIMLILTMSKFKKWTIAVEVFLFMDLVLFSFTMIVLSRSLEDSRKGSLNLPEIPTGTEVAIKDGNIASITVNWFLASIDFSAISYKIFTFRREIQLNHREPTVKTRAQV